MLKGLRSLFSLAALTSVMFSLLVVDGTTVSAEVGNQPEPIVSAADDTKELNRAGYGDFPLLFEQNKGQTSEAVKFISRNPGYTVYMTQSETVFALDVDDPSDGNSDRRGVAAPIRRDVLRMRFAGANTNPTISGGEPAATKANYYTGKNRLENVPNYRSVKMDRVYDGIDAIFYGNASNQLEYDFVVAPHVDPAQIKLAFSGAESIAVDRNGDLLIKTPNTQLIQNKPIAFQEVEGTRKSVDADYQVSEDGAVSFVIGEYDRSRPLVVDPAVRYLTYFGGSAFERADSIKVDSAGNAFVIGSTNSLDFPEANSRDSVDAAVFISKISPDGQSLIYNTFMDGNSEDGRTNFVVGFEKNDIAIDSAGNAYVAGVTESANFPVTDGAYQTVRLCSRQFGICIFPEEAFVAKLDPQGQIIYSTFLGGRETDFANGIAIDSSGRAYVAGGTRSGLLFPTKNAYQGTGFFGASPDAFMTVLNAQGSDIIYSTGLGGYDADNAYDIGIDSANNVYVSGETESEGTFPTKNAEQTANGGGLDAFIARFNPFLSGESSLVYSTFLGGGGTERAFAIAVAPNGTSVVTGVTGSATFPLKNAFDSTNQINEAFVTQYSASGAMLNSSFLGGADQDEGADIALGTGGTIWITGLTLSNNFPVAVPFQSTRRGLHDAFVTKIRFGVNGSPGVSSSSFLGGSGEDVGLGITVRGNTIYLVGQTASNNLLTTPGVIKQSSTANATNPDGFIAKILDSRKETIGTFDPVNTVFDLRNTLDAGAAAIVVDRGIVGDLPVAGDFNGDGIDTVSTFNSGVWKIQNFNVPGGGYSTGPITSNFGLAGDLPVVGDWDGDGIETIGTYRPSAGQFFLSNAISNPQINFQVTFGIAEDIPVAGDWDGDGIDSVGVFRPSAGQFFLTNDNVLAPNIDLTVFFGTNGDLPVAGDWNGDGRDSIGVWRTSTLEFFLSNDNINIANQFIFGAAGDRPVVGDWDGRPNQ